MERIWQNTPGILIDFLLILTAFLLREPLREFSTGYLSAATVIALLLQIAAFAGSSALLFGSAAASDGPTRTHPLQLAVFGACLLVAVFGPQWMHVPGEALKHMGTDGVPLAGVFFLGIYAAQIAIWVQFGSNPEWFEGFSPLQLRLLCLPPIGLFLLLTETILLSSLHLHPDLRQAWWVLPLLVGTYLPIRLFLVFRPPFAWLEFASALFAFYVFLGVAGFVQPVF